MSYLGTLVGTPPAAARLVAAAAAPEGVVPLEQHVEVEAAAMPTSAPVKTEASPAVGPAGAPVAEAQRPMGVDDALQTAFAWVTSSPPPDAETRDATAVAAPVAAFEAHDMVVSAPKRRDPLQAPAARQGPAADASTPALPLPAQRAMAAQPGRAAPRMEAASVADAPLEPLHTGTQPWDEPLPSRFPGSAAQGRVAAQGDKAAPSASTSQLAGVHVHIGSIALQVRTPPAPPPPAPATVPAVHATTEPARSPSPAFAFSARRHHLRWG